MADVNLHALGAEYQQLRHGNANEQQQALKTKTIVEQLGLPGTPAADILSTLGKPDEMVPFLNHDPAVMTMPGPVMDGTATRPPYYFVYYNRDKHDYYYFKIDSVKETVITSDWCRHDG